MTRIKSTSSPMLLTKITEKLVSITAFSQGKARAIFADVEENDNEYIVLKNNLPTAVLVSVRKYKSVQARLRKYEKMFDELENQKLLKRAQNRKADRYAIFEDVLLSEGFNLEEIKKLSVGIDFTNTTVTRNKHAVEGPANSEESREHQGWAIRP